MQYRKLEFFEVLLYHAHQAGMSQMTLHLELNSIVNVKTINKALYTLYQKHPLLAARIKSLDNSLSFICDVPFSNIIINEISVSSEAERTQELLKASKQQIDLSVYNWNLNIINDSDHSHIVLHISHVIADGLSMINLLQELLHNLDEAQETISLAPAPYPLHPAMETLLSHSLTINDHFSNQSHPNPNHTFIDRAPLDTSSTESFPFEKLVIPPKIYTSLANLSKSIKISVNALLNAALLKTYWNETGKAIPLQMGFAINLRNKVEPTVPRDICGNYFCARSIFFDEFDSELSLVEVANLHQSKLRNILSEGAFLPNQYEHQLMNKKIRDMFGNKSSSMKEQIGSSYIGEIGLKSRHFKVLKFDIIPKSAGQINLMSYVFNDHMYLNFCYPQNYISKKRMQRFVQSFNNVLTRALM